MKYEDAVNLTDSVFWLDPTNDIEYARYLLRVAMYKAMYVDDEITLTVLNQKLELLKIRFEIKQEG